MDAIYQWFVPAILFLVIIGVGFWVSKLGKPYHGLLFNIHKLIALGAAILTGIRIFRLNPWETFPVLAILFIALSFLGVIAMFATGAMMSIQDQVKRTPKLVHQISASIVAGAMIIALLLFYQ